MRISNRNLGKFIAVLLVFSLMVICGWIVLPLRTQNAVLSNLYDDFYAPVFDGNIPIWENVHRKIEFSPEYYGEYGLFVVVTGSMSDLAYPVRSMPGKLTVTITQDGEPTVIEHSESWTGTVGHKDGKTAYELFAFHVRKNVHTVTMDIRVTEPFTYFKTRQPVRVIIKSAYQM
jgi:hypothetical protein